MLAELHSLEGKGGAIALLVMMSAGDLMQPIL